MQIISTFFFIASPRSVCVCVCVQNETEYNFSFHTQGPCGEIKATFHSKQPPEPGQKQAPPPLSQQLFKTRSARNVDRDIQLPDGCIATRPLCCFPRRCLQGRTHTHKNTYPLVLGPHMSCVRTLLLPPSRPLYVLANTCERTVSNKRRRGGDRESNLGSASTLTVSISVLFVFILFAGIFWDAVLIVGWWE